VEELADIVRAAQAGDLDAFGLLVHRFQDMAYASAYALIGDAHLAEDATQEAFLQAYFDLPMLPRTGGVSRLVSAHRLQARRSPDSRQARGACPPSQAAVVPDLALGRLPWPSVANCMRSYVRRLTGSRHTSGSPLRLFYSFGVLTGRDCRLLDLAARYGEETPL